MLQRIESALCSADSVKEINRIQKAIVIINNKKKKLLDMRLDDLIDQESYDEKNDELIDQLAALYDELAEYENDEARTKNIKKRLSDFRKVLEDNETLSEFDRTVFESIIEKVIVGGYDDEGNVDPSMLTFIYKTGFTNNVDGSKYKPPRKNSKNKSNAATGSNLCSLSANDGNELCSCISDDTRWKRLLQEII